MPPDAIRAGSGLDFSCAAAIVGGMFKALQVLVLAAVVVGTGCATRVTRSPSSFTRFIGMENFSKFDRSLNPQGETVLLSPEIKLPIPWNELIVSWNAQVPSGTYLKIEASAISPAHRTKFYTLGNWSLDNQSVPRASMRGQQDADGNVDTDTLVLAQSAKAAQIRVTLAGTNGGLPTLKFLGASFANTKITTSPRESSRAAWGKIIATPEHSQHGSWTNKGWCSPTSLSMVMSRWAEVMNRPEMNLTVPEVAAKVYDADFKGTGNWPFNTAFAGSFNGMRSYVTRFDDLTEVEDWIAAGIPVILSARWDWLLPGRPLDRDGHLIVCIGFTEKGDVVINDPATRLEKGEAVRRIYKRENVIHSWTKSRNAVYLVYLETEKIPADPFGHWEK